MLETGHIRLTVPANGLSDKGDLARTNPALKLRDMNKNRLFDCPCCGFPTLAERARYDICTVCWWEDDGQGDHDANEVLGGPNGQYSLLEARKNFSSHGHMYKAGQGIKSVEEPTKERLLLIEFVMRAGPKNADFDLRRFYGLLEASDTSN